MVITEFLDLSALLVPERMAITFEGRRYSYAQLKERVNRLADSLNRLGLRKGDRAAILEVNCNEYVEACFGVVKAGVIFVPLNFRIRQEELVYLVNKAEPKILFVGSRYIDMVSSVRSKLPSVERFIAIGGKLGEISSYKGKPPPKPKSLIFAAPAWPASSGPLSGLCHPGATQDLHRQDTAAPVPGKIWLGLKLRI